MTEVTVEQLTLNDTAAEIAPANNEEEVLMEVSGGPPDDEANPAEENDPTPIQEVSNVDGQVVETSNMLATVKKHLDDNDWKYDVIPLDDRVIIKTGGKGLNGSYAAIMDIKEERNIFVVYVKSQINFPSQHLDKLANFLTRANYGILCGNFELDMSDGEVRFKNASNVSGSFLSDEMAASMIHVSLITMDKYFGAIVKVAYGVMTPEVAIRDVEGSTGAASYLAQALGSLAGGDDKPDEPVQPGQ